MCTGHWFPGCSSAKPPDAYQICGMRLMSCHVFKYGAKITGAYVLEARLEARAH